MSNLALTSELDAINIMLDCIGESPVSSLEVSGLVDVAKAKALLTETSRAVQKLGWHFNEERNYPLMRDVNGHITLPPNALKVDTTENFDKTQLDVTQRGQQMYNRAKHTYVFDRNLKVDIVFMLPWDSLPEAARHYILIKAARIFQARQLGSDTLHRFSEQEEFDALAALKDAEGDNADYNMFSDSWSVANILYR